jgi:hypothetical protein
VTTGRAGDYFDQRMVNRSRPTVHELLDAVEAEVLADHPSFASFVPTRASSPLDSRARRVVAEAGHGGDNDREGR